MLCFFFSLFFSFSSFFFPFCSFSLQDCFLEQTRQERKLENVSFGKNLTRKLFLNENPGHFPFFNSKKQNDTRQFLLFSHQLPSPNSPLPFSLSHPPPPPPFFFIMSGGEEKNSSKGVSFSQSTEERDRRPHFEQRPSFTKQLSKSITTSLSIRQERRSKKQCCRKECVVLPVLVLVLVSMLRTNVPDLHIVERLPLPENLRMNSTVPQLRPGEVFIFFLFFFFFFLLHH